MLTVVLAAIVAAAAATSAPTSEELHTHPYLLKQGGRGAIERAERIERLAAIALPADPVRAARHYAIVAQPLTCKM